MTGIVNQSQLSNLDQGDYYASKETIWTTKVDKNGRPKGKRKKLLTFQRWFRAESRDGRLLSSVRFDFTKVKGRGVWLESTMELAKSNKFRWMLGKKATFIPDMPVGR